MGHVLCHDMTQIIKDTYKGPRFRKGHVVTAEDIPVLLSMGKEHLYVWEMTPGMVHENDAAERLLALCGTQHMSRSPVKEGKIELKADCDGLFQVDSARLMAVNGQDEVMIATRKGDKLAGMRVIPLIISEEKLQKAEKAAGNEPLLALHPFVRRTACIVATGSEVKKGLIKDTFTPVVIDKLKAYGIETWEAVYSGDGVENVRDAVLGEYGATSMIAGYTPGKTATVSTTVYQLWQINNDALALKWVLVNVAISAVILLVVNMLEKKNLLTAAGRGRRQTA